MPDFSRERLRKHWETEWKPNFFKTWMSLQFESIKRLQLETYWFSHRGKKNEWVKHEMSLSFSCCRRPEFLWNFFLLTLRSCSKTLILQKWSSKSWEKTHLNSTWKRQRIKRRNFHDVVRRARTNFKQKDANRQELQQKRQNQKVQKPQSGMRSIKEKRSVN